jgi:hypothetical protein
MKIKRDRLIKQFKSRIRDGRECNHMWNVAFIAEQITAIRSNDDEWELLWLPTDHTEF